MLARELRQPGHQWLVAVHRAAVALLEGDFDAAEGLVAEASSLGERAQTWSSAVSYGLQLYVLRWQQGRLTEVEELVRRSASEHATYPIFRCVLTHLLAELGAEDEAARELQSLAVDRFASIPFDEEWDVSVCLLAQAAARLGDVESAATLYDLLLPYAGRVTFSYPEVSVGPVARYLGLLASAVGRNQDASRHFEEAIAISEAIGARSWLLRSRENLAQARSSLVQDA